MTTSLPAQSEEKYQPTPEQIARATAQRRFNALFVYSPLLLFTLALLGFSIAMIYFAVVREPWRPMVSAVADLLVILTVLPTLLLCALLPAGAVAVVIQGRQRGWTPLHSLQVLFWRLDSLVSRVQRIVHDGAVKAAPYTTRFRASFVRIDITARKLIETHPTDESVE